MLQVSQKWLMCVLIPMAKAMSMAMAIAIAMAMTVPMSVLAQQADSELELVPLQTELRLSDMAKVVTGIARPSDCLAPVTINKIDGEMRILSAQGFLIEPGVHTINGKATLDLTNCPLNDSNLIIGSAPDLEVNFELGNTYYIGYYHQSDNTEEWQLVVWGIETNP